MARYAKSLTLAVLAMALMIAAPAVAQESYTDTDPSSGARVVVPVKPLTGLPTTPRGAASTTPRDITITTGGTAQLVMAANASRRSYYVFNPDASENMWCSVTSATPAANAAGSFAIAPTSPNSSSPGFGMETSPTSNAIYCVAATTGHKITAWESQ